MKRAVVACAAALAFAVTGCGSQSASGPADAAKVVPAGTLAFASLELAPQGDQKADFDAAFGKVLGADPETKLAKGLTDAIKEEGSKLDYATDVKPWLGESAAAVLTGIGGGKPDWAVLIASTDDGKARAAIDKDLAGSRVESRSYRGVDYREVSDKIANGVVGHFLVAGTVPAFKAIVDTDKDGKSLADSDTWKNSVGNRAEGRIGLGFVDIKAIVQSAVSGAQGPAAALAPLALGFIKIRPFIATLDANPDSFVLDISSPGTANDKRGPIAASSPLIETLPGDSWGALAVPHVGALLRKLAAALKLHPLIGAQYGEFAKQLKQSSGLDIERDVLAGIGDVGAFVRGSTTKSISGGAVIAPDDRAALRRTLTGLPRLLARSGSITVHKARGGFDVTSRSLPRAIEVRSGGPGVVATYGPAQAALAPATRLGTTALFRRAAAELGARPTLFVAISPILDLVRASDPGRNDMSADNEQRLRHVDFVVVGVRRDAGLDVIRAVVGLH